MNLDLKKIKNKYQMVLALVGGIYSYNVLRRFRTLPPTELQINITYLCNLKCRMCHIWKMSPKDELTFNEWKKIMEDPIFKNIRRLSIAGGEPTLAKNLIKLTRLYLDSMPKLVSLGLISNGFATQLVTSVVEEIADLCKKRGVKFAVSTSLDGVGKTHDIMRGVPGAFGKTQATILKLKSLQSKNNFWLGVSGVICRKNLYSIKDVKVWCKKNKIPFNFQIVGFHETYVQNLQERDDLDFQNKDKKYLFSLLEELASSRSWLDLRSSLKAYYWSDMLSMYKDNNNRTTPCPFLVDAFVLDSFGDVYYCLSEKKIGNCRRGRTVSEIYYAPQNLAFRHQLSESACLACNSGCFVTSAIAKDFKKFIWFWLTGKLGPPGVY